VDGGRAGNPVGPPLAAGDPDAHSSNPRPDGPRLVGVGLDVHWNDFRPRPAGPRLDGRSRPALFCFMHPYAPRDTRFHDLRQVRGWTLKRYAIRLGDEPLDWDSFAPALEMSEQSLPDPDPAAGRPGYGFVIAHRGRGADYLVLGWWSAENELPLSVWVRRDGNDWRPAHDGESICVWDLEVIWHERQAWVHWMLREGGPDPAAYLDAVPVAWAGHHGVIA
jgi:hypothetical protein